MSITLVSNSYLDENSSKIRAKPVPWEVQAAVTSVVGCRYLPRPVQGYQRAGLITTDELALIKKVDRQTRPKIESLHTSDGQTYALLYLRLLKKLQRIDTQSCILVLIADALTGMLSSPSVPDMELYARKQTMRKGYPSSRPSLHSPNPSCLTAPCSGA